MAKEHPRVTLYAVKAPYTLRGDAAPRVYKAEWFDRGASYTLSVYYGADAPGAFGHVKVLRKAEVPGKTAYSGYIGHTRAEAITAWRADALRMRDIAHKEYTLLDNQLQSERDLGLQDAPVELTE